MEMASDPGIPGWGWSARRESGNAPDPGGGGGGTDGRVPGLGAGGGALGRKPMLDGDRDDGTPFPRGVESGARIGGGTKARRAIKIQASAERSPSLLSLRRPPAFPPLPRPRPGRLDVGW
jgi:hypothetical protein